MSHWLLKLLGLKNAERIVSGSLSFESARYLLPVIVGCVAAIVLAILAYRTPGQEVSRWRRILLAALRVAAYIVLAIVFLRPVLDLKIESKARIPLAILIDNTASMKLKDPRGRDADQRRAALAFNDIDPKKGLKQTSVSSATPANPTRLEVVQAVFKNPRLALLSRLEKDFDLEVYAFSNSLTEISGLVSETNRSTQYGWIPMLRADGTETAIGDAIHELTLRKQGQKMAGVILVTDGANNSGAAPDQSVRILKESGLPLYIYGVGITSPRDIVVEAVVSDDVVFVHDQAAVKVRVRGQSLRGETAKLKLSLGGQTVATKDIKFTDDEEQWVSMTFTPPREGTFALEASIPPRSDETVRENNAKSKNIRAINAKIRVLLIDQTPRWEYRYLQSMLLRDRRVELKCFLVEADPRVINEPGSPYIARFPASREELFKYDLVVFGDVSPTRFGPQDLANIQEFVSQFGGALIIVAGKQFTPGAYKRTPLEKISPVEFDSSGSEPPETIHDRPISLELTGLGQDNAMLHMSEESSVNLAIWKGLPPIYWRAPVGQPKPAAEVLLVDATSKGARSAKSPIVAIQQYGIGSVLYVGTDNTWRWRKNAGEDYHTRFWAQALQRMAIQKLLGGSKRTQLSSSKENYMTGERVTVYARLYTASYDPMRLPVVKAAYATKGQSNMVSKVDLYPLPDQPGQYRGDFMAPGPGVYDVWVDHDPATKLGFTVTAPMFENGESAMNESMLSKLAAQANGKFLREEDLFTLPELLQRRAERVITSTAVLLWASPALFLLLVALFGFEWFLRKKWFLK